jgi:NMD protein affecting ribosome stability and mRNA decay
MSGKTVSCIVCGRPANVDAQCDDCFLKKNLLFKLEDFTISYCGCGSYFERMWRKSEDFIKDAIESRIKTKNRIVSIKISSRTVGNRVYATVECRGYIEPSKKMKTETKKIMIVLRKHKCDHCIKLLGGYYEAVIQIRGKNRDVILKKIEKLAPRDSVVSVEELPEGYNIKFVSKKDAIGIVSRLRGFYKINESYKLVTKKKGKELYRNFYAVR